MADQQFCLRWNNHQSTLISVFDTLLENGTLVDCTLAAEGQYLKAHKVVLSACSPYLETLLSQHYEKHPIVILKDVKFSELKSMMDYMYRGEVNISQDQLGTFLKAAESLQIKGLSDNGADGDARDVGSTAKATPARKTTQPAQPLSRPSEPQRPDLPESPAHRDDGTISPSSRKKRRIRRGSQGDDSSLGDSHLETSNSCDAQSTPIVPNIPASSSITATPIKAPIVKPEQTELVNRIDTNSLPPESGLLKEKIEPSEPLLEPKTEYLDDMNNDDSVEDLTLDDDDEMDGMDVSNMSNMSNMSRPGPSHGNDISQLSNQGFNPWQLGGNQTGTDEVFMAAQEAVGAHRDSQDKMEQEEREQSNFPKPVFISTIKQENLEGSAIDIPVASNSNDPVPSISDVASSNCIQPKQEISEDLSINEPLLHQQILIKEEELSSDDEVNSNERLGENLDQEESADSMFNEKDNIYQPEFKGGERCQTESVMTNSVFLKEEYTEDQSTVQLPKDSGMEEMSFGNHFLAGCSELRTLETSGLDRNSELNNGPFGDSYVSYCGKGKYKFLQNDKANSTYPNALNTLTEPQLSNNMRHVNQTHNKQYCSLCNQLVNVRNLTEHIARVHAESIIYCQYCNYKTPYKSVLRSHVIRRHNFGQQPIDCPYCKYASLSILDVEYHIEEKHRKPKVYFHCNQCDYKAQCRGNLNYHVVSKHTKIKNYVCPHCDYKCIIFHNMKRHGLKVHNKKLREETCSLKNNLPVNTSLCSNK